MYKSMYECINRLYVIDTCTCHARTLHVDTSACPAVPLLQQRMLHTQLNTDSSQKLSEVFYCYYNSCLVSFQPGLQYKLFVGIGIQGKQ